MKYLLSSFGLHNPFIELDLPEHAVYPVTLNGVGGYDLDYTSLLISEGYEFDSAAYDYIVERGPSFLKPMASSLKRLKSEGMLDLIDVGALVAQHREQLIAKTKTISKDVDTWLPLLREQWAELQVGRPAFQSQFGDRNKFELNSHHFTVLNAAYKLRGFISNEDVVYFSSILARRSGTLTKQMRVDAQTIIEPLVAHLLIHELLRLKRHSVILDWDDSRKYYDKLYETRWDDVSDEVRIAQRAKAFLTLTMPTLRANNIEAVVQFMRDRKAVSSLRGEVIRSINAGGDIDEHWWSEYLMEIVSARLQKDSVMRKVRYGGSALGLIIPGASIAADFAAEAAVSIAEEALEHKLGRRDHYWFYALQKVNSQNHK